MVLLGSQMYKPVSRDRLFFDQYEYSMCFRFEGSGRMRTLTHQAIQHAVNYASMFRRGPVTPVERLLDLCDTINAIDVPYKRMVYTDWQYFYTNDTGFFQILQRFPGVSHCYFQQAVVDRPRDVVMLKESNYQWRTYFREKHYTKDQLGTLSKFLLARPQQFRVTSHWQQRLPRTNFYITRSFFVDHHDEQDAMLLQIAMPGAVRKTVPIIEKQ